ncbi:hypothetical protein D3C87_1425560 [compost metagenome]
MALEQHFGDPCRSAEVAVDLEWRVVAKQIRQRGCPQNPPHTAVGLIAILQPGIQIKQPGGAPAGMSAPGFQTRLQRQGRCSRQLRRFVRADHIARIQAVQMGDMTVSRLLLGKIPVPFPYPPVRSDPGMRKTRPLSSYFPAEFRLRIQNFRSLNTVGEQFGNQRHIHS